MPETSLTDMGLIFMVLILFISNYFFVRKLRKVVDSHITTNTALRRLQNKILQSRLVQATKGISSGYRKGATSSDEESSRDQCANQIYSFCLGKHKMEPAISKKFPEWEPIPFKLGIISTALAIIFATIVLSDNALTGKLAISTQGDKRSGLCASNDFDDKIKSFENHIRGENVTNYYTAKDQFDITLRFDQVLSSNATKDWNKECDGLIEQARKDEIRDKCTISQKVCIDDWGLSILCKTITMTLPGCVTTLEGATLDVQEPEVDPIESDADLSALDQLNQRSAILIQKLLRQIDIAGSLYSFFVAVTLFFPTPIVLFRSSYIVRGKQLLCGVQKYTFMVTVLIIFWTYEYFLKALALPEVQIFFKNLVTDPCFLDGDFIMNRSAIVKDTCKDLIEMENKWGLVDSSINGTLDVMKECSTPFSFRVPCSNLYTNFSESDVDKLDLTKELNYMQKGCPGAFAPSSFLGNETICVDREYSRSEILVANDTGLNFWELWIKSGLLATLLIKFSIANLGVALLKLADPLYSCNGEYESPPEVTNQNTNEDESYSHVDVAMKDKMSKVLKTIALRECLVWGCFTNLSLFTLVIASSSSLEQFVTLDYIIFSVIIILTIGVSIGCYYFSKFASVKVDNMVT